MNNRLKDMRELVDDAGIDIDDDELSDIIDEAVGELASDKHLKALEGVWHGVRELAVRKSDVILPGGSINIPLDEAAKILAVAVADLRDSIAGMMKSLSATVERVEVAANKDTLTPVTKAMEMVADQVRSVKPPAPPQITVTPNVTIDLAYVAKSIGDLGRAIENSKRAPAPNVSVDMSGISDSIKALKKAIEDGKRPVVNVESQKAPAPIIHVHIPKLLKSRQVVERDDDGKMVATVTEHTYES